RFKTPRPQRVVVLDPVGLGDIITCEPLIHELLAANYETVVCSKSAFKVLFEKHPKLLWSDLHVPFASTDEGAKYALKYYLSDPFRSDFRKLRQESQGAV